MVTSRFAAPMRVARGVQWTALLVVVALLLTSAIVTGAVPLVLRTLVIATALVTAISPASGLVMLAALAPLGYVLAFSLIANWDDCPFDMAQAVTLAFFAGYLWSMRGRFLSVERKPDSLALPARLMTIVILGSMAVQLRVLQVWHDYPLDYAASLFRFLHTDYLVIIPDRRAWVDGRACLTVGAYLIEGIALLRCTRTLSSGRPELARRIGVAFAVTAIVAAALGIAQPLNRAESLHRPLFDVLSYFRWSTPVLPSLNTAGPFFMLLGFITLGVAIGESSGPLRGTTHSATRRRAADMAVRITCGVGALAAFAIMWLTQTRSAIVAGIAVVVASLLWSALRRLGLSRTRAAAVTAVGAIVVIVTVTFLNPLHVLARGVNWSLEFRYRFAQVGWRMFRSAPLTGVGIGQYDGRYLDFATREVLLMDRRINNAHNYLLWLAAELGILGLVPFVWLVGRAVWDGARNLIDSPGRERQLAYLGLVGFLITWSISQPLNVQTVAFPFWIVLGVAAAPSVLRRAPTTVRPVRSRRGPLLVALATLVVVISIPARAARGLEQVDLARVSYGFYNGSEDDQRRFTWAGPHVRMFMRAPVPAVEMFLGSVPPLTPHGADVRILVDDRPAQSLTLAPGEWRRVRLAPDPAAHRAKYWQIDIEVRPIDLPAGTPEYEHRIGIAEIERMEPPAGS